MSTDVATSVDGRVEDLARDLWWTWNPAAQQLFESLDPVTWRATDRNPLATLAGLSPTRRETLENDASFHALLAQVESERATYRSAETWWDRSSSSEDEDLLVAYFCMEYALHESLPLYAGGLGVLAGDHLKTASDLGIPLVAIGLLYRHGYYRQEITRDGSVRVLYPTTDVTRQPLEDTGERIHVDLDGDTVWARIWKTTIGRTTLYLLDTDLDENSQAGRDLTAHLYGGDHEHRVRQEVLLGIGGTHLLHHLKIPATVYHLNEGHAAFACIERIRRLVTAGLDYDDAVRRVQASSVFTTHTPVPQGNDRFPADLVLRYLGKHAERIGLHAHDFLALGREHPADDTETFCMTVLALKLANRANGVAELHGDTARKMWVDTYGTDDPAAVPIGHVTNGVHVETWISPYASEFYRDRLGADFAGADPDYNPWSRLDEVSSADLWALRQRLRRASIAELRRLLRDQITYHHGSQEEVAELYDVLDHGTLTIGFARRFALYKRAPLVFRDIDRLESILASSERPVQLLFAGKAHPNDHAGHEFVQQVYEFSRRPALRGRVYLVQNYDMHVGRTLTQGCDVWLNNPIRPMEASGTSGMKVPLNGGINCSILDGWWAEAFDGDNGWSLGGDQELPREEQDAADAEAIYTTLEQQVVPDFYDRGDDGVPERWVARMRRSMQTTFPEFSTHRMLRDYAQDYYRPSHPR